MRYWFDVAQELLVTEFEGTLKNTEVGEILQAEFADPRTAETTKHLIDLQRATNSDASPNDLRRRATLVSEYVRQHPNGATHRMLLVRSDVDYGLGRMFEAFAREMGHTEVFRDRREAVAWLDVRLPDSTNTRSGADCVLGGSAHG